MSLLNVSDYSDLAQVSSAAAKRTPGKFYKVFITGKKRPSQEIGHMQAIYEIKDNNTDDDYLIHNAADVRFIPYFIKKTWEKTVFQSINGQDVPRLVAFGFDESVPKIDDSCKYVYIIAGLLLDPETKKAAQHKREIVDAGISVGDPVLIYFRCDGIKYSGAMTLNDELASKTSSLVPLSDSPEFEKLVVTPRRFICSAKVGTAQSSHGDKDVFQFDVMAQLPDKVVLESVMKSAKSLMPEFIRQFDKTQYLSSGTPTSNVKNEVSKNETIGGDNIAFDDNKSENVTMGEEFELGI